MGPARRAGAVQQHGQGGSDQGGDRVTGARVLSPGGGCGEEILPADLVVDATGRGGRAPAWLTRMGYDSSAEEQIRVDVRYASQHLRLRPGALGGKKLIGIGAQLAPADRHDSWPSSSGSPSSSRR